MSVSSDPRTLKQDVKTPGNPHTHRKPHFLKRQWRFIGTLAALATLYFLFGSNQATTSPKSQLWRSAPKFGDLDRWIEVEKEVALEKILHNIGPVVGAKDGLVVASPSQGEADDLPDYYVSSFLLLRLAETIVQGVKADRCSILGRETQQ